jgi:hypothetical protein
MATGTLPIPALAKARNGTAPHVSAQQGEPSAQLIAVSPAMAADWLRTRHGNRPLSQQRVRQIAAAIKSGFWMVNGGTIVTCPDNRLLDGQHRCAAIEASGTTVQTLVCFGVDPASFPTMDQGRKRSGADILAIGGHGYAGTLASALRWTWRYENTMMCAAVIPLNDFELLGYLAAHQGISSSVSWGCSIKSIIPPGVGCMLHWKMSERNAPLAKEFFMGLASGLELTATDPVYTVRERYIHQDRALHHVAVAERCATVVRAWNARRGGRPMPQGRWAGTNSTFPVIE